MADSVRVPQQQRSIETRNSILDAARALFSEKGFHGTNSKEIATRAGVSIGSFYSYFKDKKVLFMEVLKAYEHERIMKILKDQNRQRLEATGSRAIVRGIIESVLEAHELSPAFDREAMAMCYADPEVEKFHAEIEHQIHVQLTETLGPDRGPAALCRSGGGGGGHQQRGGADRTPYQALQHPGSRPPAHRSAERHDSPLPVPRFRPGTDPPE